MLLRVRASRPSTTAPHGAEPARARAWPGEWVQLSTRMTRRPLRGGVSGRSTGLLAWFARLQVRRAFAAMLALTVLSFSFESLIADVHDGDAPAAEVARVPETSPHTGDAALVHSAAWSVADVAQAGPADGLTLAWADGSSQAQDDRAPGDAPPTSHSAHVCHGAHEHAAAAPSLPHAAAVAAVGEVTRPTHVPHALSRATEPPVRPPIA